MKIIDDVNEKVFKGVRYDDLEYVTPEMFGAFGDGIHDDTKALNDSVVRATQVNKPIHCSHKYLITNCVYIENINKLRITGGRFLFRSYTDCMLYVKTCRKLILDHITAECIPYTSEDFLPCSPVDEDKHLVTACNVIDVSIKEVDCKNMYTIHRT